MKYDILIKNGHVVDTNHNINAICDIGIIDGKIVSIKTEESLDSNKIIDASGCFVFPGLIDFHGHFNFDGSYIGAIPSLLAASGVTYIVDAGSCGCYNFPSFYKNVIIHSSIRIKAFLSCYSMGLGGGSIYENFDGIPFDKKIIPLIKANLADIILGLKIRCSIPLVKNLAPLKQAIEIAEELGIAVCVHTTNPPCSILEIANLLRKGDIFCHVYHNKGDTILDENGIVKEGIWEARERGVIFDVANGNNHFSNQVCLKSLKQGFYPDVISTDMTNDKLYYGLKARSLPFVMSKFISLGMSLFDVVRCVTEIPASIMGMEGQIGTLSPGAFADVAIMSLIDKNFPIMDSMGDIYKGNKMLIPQMTIINGGIAYCQENFNLVQ